MSKIDGYYRSAITYTQSPPTTETVSSSFNYTIADNLYGNSILLYTGLIPNPNPLTGAADGDKYTAPNGVDVVEKVSAQVLDQVEDSSFAFTQSRLTHIIPGAVYGITVWSKDQAGQYTVPVPPKFYDIFFYPPAGTYVVYFKEKYKPIYQSDVFDIPFYAPAITCYRYCGPVGIENTPSQMGIGTFITTEGDSSYPATGLTNMILKNIDDWAYATYQTVSVPGTSLYNFCGWGSLYSTFMKKVFNFGTNVATGDFASYVMKQTEDLQDWEYRNLEAEGNGATLKFEYSTLVQDPVTNELYSVENSVGNLIIKYGPSSTSYVVADFLDLGDYIFSQSILLTVACNGVFSFIRQKSDGEYIGYYTDDFSTFSEVTGLPSGYFSGAMRIVDPQSERVWYCPSSSDTAYISTDSGRTYTSFTTPDSLGYGLYQNDLGYKDGTYIFCSNKLYTSTDLSSWTERTTNFSTSDDRIKVHNVEQDVWFALQVDNNTTEVSISSDNGTTWSKVDMPSSAYHMDAVKAGGIYYILSSTSRYGGNLCLYKSTNLEDWSIETSISREFSGDASNYYKWASTRNGNPIGLIFTTFDGNPVMSNGLGIHYYDGTSWTTDVEICSSFTTASDGGLIKIK